ncbi:hypothetical protein GCM10009105_07940 [Dokdonella soli]|uniref:Transposase DDE domain-containing protein n=2 Tax=Dokdonella soli TaxID=529810 RepID=A0ABN1IDA9_9GAMM
MRGADAQQLGMFSYVSVEERVPADHPIRKRRALVDATLKEFDDVLAARCAAGGRESILPEDTGGRVQARTTPQLSLDGLVLPLLHRLPAGP